MLKKSADIVKMVFTAIKSPMLFAIMAGGAFWYSGSLLASPVLTPWIIGSFVFGIGMIIQQKRDLYKQKAAGSYLAKNQAEMAALTDAELMSFERGAKAYQHVSQYISSFFDINAILHPKDYYAGYEFAESGYAIGNFTNFYGMSRLACDKQVVEYQKLSQLERDKRLYQLKETGRLGEKTTAPVLQMIASLLKAGANPNYLPEGESDPLSLIECAINGADFPLYTLLLKYNATLFRDSEESNKMLWEGISRTFMHPMHVKPQYIAIADSIAAKLGTTKEEIRTGAAVQKPLPTMYSLAQKVNSNRNRPE
ncbi:MAG: hypothetical protein JSS07_08120 [Proteobacteria bacterium]|nr:hypothetical protein [Pseudomonadota bacterium]